MLCVTRWNTPFSRRPTSRKSDEGDFGEVAYSVLYNRCLNDGNFTIAQVNEKLDAIAINNTTQKPGVNTIDRVFTRSSHIILGEPVLKQLVEKDLVSMLHGMSAREQKLLIRVILKQVRFGLGTTGTLHAFHPDAKDLYDVCNSLRKVCATLHDPTVRLHEIGIQLFTAFRPMLAERGAMDKLEKQLDCTKFYQETKHDGERFQLHKNGEEYMYFSR
ncbi:unnamed protein product [Cyprideis torosa]|uniref:Uncharacterized protein n=1 Tax=Cyprideis torosa TaxID=163714 RepID=A0A7R8ZLV3_9CRUS|nr:unnamed protein product [Cyprideis torosa]CAG0887523.1 unnamed protein product [Cyprideis torosa]